jgi:hypothetical protein
MKVKARESYLIVELNYQEWYSLSDDQQSFLQAKVTILHQSDYVGLCVPRKVWPEVRTYFPQLKTALPRTWQNV